MDFTFEWYFLACLFLLPILCRYVRKPVTLLQENQALCVPFFKQIQKLLKTQSHALPSFGRGFIFWLAWTCCILALMRPVSFGEGIALPTKARQVMLVLDVSGSMAEQDFILNDRRVTRLGAVKQLADRFLQDRKGDAVGLTIFGTEPYIYIPLTQDIETARNMLREVGVGIAGTQTAIGDALGLALKQMKDIKSDEKVIILFSDGFANTGVMRPAEALEAAKQMKVKVYTVGLGADEQIVNFGPFARRVNPSADLDEKLLQNIAEQTGAKYFRVKDTKELKDMYAELDKLEPVDSDTHFIRPQTELFYIPLAIGMCLFLIGFFIKQRLA